MDHAELDAAGGLKSKASENKGLRAQIEHFHAAVLVILVSSPSQRCTCSTFDSGARAPDPGQGLPCSRSAGPRRPHPGGRPQVGPCDCNQLRRLKWVNMLTVWLGLLLGQNCTAEHMAELRGGRGRRGFAGSLASEWGANTIVSELNPIKYIIPTQVAVWEL